MKFLFSEEQISSLNMIISFLAKRDLERLDIDELNKQFGIKQADLLILLGNSIPFITEKAAEAMLNGVSKEILIVGGIGHSTEYLRENIRNHKSYNQLKVDNRPEADILKDMILSFATIDEKHILIENTSENCGSNAKEALVLLKKHDRNPKSIILMQDPIMQLRTYASFQKEWKDQNDILFINYSALIPTMETVCGELTYKKGLAENYGLWNFNRLLSLVMGEIPRLVDDVNGYGPRGKGFISHVHIPIEIIEAYEFLSPSFVEFLNMRTID